MLRWRCSHSKMDGEIVVMEYSAVIFDLDGTLLDTLADIAEAANRVLAARQFPTHELESYRSFVGNGVEVLMERALPPEQCTPAIIATSGGEFRRIYSEIWNRTTTPYPEIHDLLAFLTQHGVQKAILSNKPHRNTQICVSEYFEPSEFAVVFGQRDDIPCKPDPTAAWEISSALAVSPSECLFLGDSDVDMQTAVRAGMTGIGATWGFRSRSELLQCGASRTIDHPLELRQLFPAPQ